MHDFCYHFLIVWDFLTTPSSQAEKISLSNPNLSISQLYKKNYQIFLSSWGQLSLIYILTHIPPPNISWYLENTPGHLQPSVRVQMLVLGICIDAL